MRAFIACLLCLCLMLSPSFALAAHFGCHHGAGCNHCGHGFVNTIVAVPVGLPSYVQYLAVADSGYGAAYGASYGEASYSQASYGQSSGGYSQSGYAQQGNWSKPKQPAGEVRNRPLVAQHCAACHAGQPGRMNLVGPLTDPQRVNAIGRVMTETTKKMPKDHELTPEQKAGIIAELSMKWDSYPDVERQTAKPKASIVQHGDPWRNPPGKEMEEIMRDDAYSDPAPPAPINRPTPAPQPQPQAAFTIEQVQQLEAIIDRIIDKKAAKAAESKPAGPAESKAAPDGWAPPVPAQEKAQQ